MKRSFYGTSWRLISYACHHCCWFITCFICMDGWFFRVLWDVGMPVEDLLGLASRWGAQIGRLHCAHTPCFQQWFCNSNDRTVTSLEWWLGWLGLEESFPKSPYFSSWIRAIHPEWCVKAADVKKTCKSWAENLAGASIGRKLPRSSRSNGLWLGVNIWNIPSGKLMTNDECSHGKPLLVTGKSTINGNFQWQYWIARGQLGDYTVDSCCFLLHFFEMMERENLYRLFGSAPPPLENNVNPIWTATPKVVIKYSEILLKNGTPPVSFRAIQGGLLHILSESCF